MSPLPPLSLYLHFPWCISKCPYCDFNSYALQSELPQDAYVAALEADLAAQLAIFGAERPLASIFMGGGMPSLFMPDAIAQLLESVRRMLPFAPDIEVTLEANPGTIERGRFAGYRDAGVNRVSLGAQSFDPAQLRALGRVHSPAETVRAAEELHAAGLTNFNLDLMYALPGQTPAQAEQDLQQALALRPRHLSHYQLTMEPGTPFAARPPEGLPGDDLATEMLERCLQRLAAAGFERYEVSAYAQRGARCRHNLNYWRFGDYLGVGAGAHGKCSSRSGPSAPLEIRRTTQWREPRRYLAHRPAQLTITPVDGLQRPFEFALNALRLVDGFSSAEFEAGTGLPFADIEVTIARLVERQLLERSDEDGGVRVRPGVRGLQFLNTALLEFLPESPLPTGT